MNRERPRQRVPTSTDIEIAVAEYFDPRINLCVPNVAWGADLNHECDLFVLMRSHCGYEVEIKISRGDMMKDTQKSHGHFDSKLKRLYFAIPEHLLKHKDLIPVRAGILLIKYTGKWEVQEKRKAKDNGDYKFTVEERYNIARLGALRIWPLKKQLRKAKK